MPTSKETAVNRALSGPELRRRIEADIARLLDAESALTSQMGYGRVAYTLRLTLHTGNVASPTSITTLDSRPPSRQEQELETRRELAADFLAELEAHAADHPDEPLSAELLEARDAVAVLGAPTGVAAIERGPTLHPPLPPDAELHATELTRTVTSPNAERLRIGLPVPVDRKQADGTVITEQVRYPKDYAEDVGEGDVRVDDVTGDAKSGV